MHTGSKQITEAMIHSFLITNTQGAAQLSALKEEATLLPSAWAAAAAHSTSNTASTPPSSSYNNSPALQLRSSVNASGPAALPGII